MKRSDWARRALPLFAVVVVTMMLVALGCRGEVDRLYFDDAPDSSTEQATLDGSMNANDGGVDVVTDAAGDASDGATTFAVGGTVFGLTGNGLMLKLNGGPALSVPPGAVTFSFPGRLVSGSSFTVSVSAQPAMPTQSCSVSAGAGTVMTADISSVLINCEANTFTIGGNVTNLEGSLVLLNNGDAGATLNSNGGYAFSVPLPNGTTYAITPGTHSALPVQDCVVSNGSGTIASANVTNANVACTTMSYPLGGMVSGLSGASGLKLTNNNVDELTVLADGTFAFATHVLSNRTYDVKVSASPPNRTCKVTKGTGTITNAAASDVSVACGFSESFDGVVAPALPVGWGSIVLQGTGGVQPFATNAASSSSAPNSAFVVDTAQAADIVLVSPMFTVTSNSATLTFRQQFQLEASVADPTLGYDGGMLEIQVNGGGFKDIKVAGGVFSAGGYTRVISSLYQNPLGGRDCWSGDSVGFMTTTVSLPAVAGDVIYLRFRQGTDKMNALMPYVGWRIDSLVVTN